MDIELLKTFLEVKQTRHFGRAAENLYLTQAAVSARIKLLESQLGTPLFTRYRNNLQLTDSGNRLINHAETILLSWERARSDVGLKTKHTQVLSIGATSGLWDLILQDALNHIHIQLPNVTLRAESLSSDILIRRLMERTIDLCLLYEPAKMTELKSVQVTQSELVLVATSVQNDAHLAVKNGYVSVDWGTAFDINFSQFYQDATTPILHTSLARIALEFILSHGGSAYLPLRMVKEYLNKTIFEVESAPVFNRPIYSCFHKENRNSNLVDQVIAILENINDEQILTS